MELIQQVPELSACLAADEAIDHEHPLVRDTVADLRSNTTDAYAYAAAAYAFVRDAIPHSADSGDMRVAWRAFDVLATRNGICHSKSHALAALLRAAGIPTALCCQGLGDENGDPGTCTG
ncbi:transglutaminase domain-containing protein [Streptomyces atratus]|uniref:transglutaminase domain-containing protein n=1 Tax=Streptomyces atratus TaxID=1893 RepID=UPI003F69C435